jgi:drug/metabolite transporter (DMT)-like permease
MLLYSDASRLVAVCLWMGGALISFIAAALSIRELSGHFNVFEINCFRTGGGLICLVLVLVCSKRLRGTISPASAPLHLPRNLVHALGGWLWTLAIAMLPFATVFSLEFTSPAWVALLAYPVLGERIRMNAIIGIAASFAGVLIILRPVPGSFQITALLPLAAALCLGLSALLTRRLTRTQGVFAILFWMMAIQFPMNLAGAVFAGSHLTGSALPSEMYLVAAVTLAVAGLCSQLCLAKALEIGPAIVVVPLDFLRVPLIAAIGAALYGEPLDGWVFVGAVIIVVGITTGLLPPRSTASQSRDRRRAVPDPS